MEIRLQKYLADAGIASRRKAEELILDGKVTVNGKLVTELGIKVVPGKDEVCYLGQVIGGKEKLVYYLLHKPEGYVTTVHDQFHRPTVIDLLKGVRERVFPVGRLDYDTSGFLILTNDGDLTYKLTHPKHEVKKTYEAKLFGKPDENQIRQFRRGLMLDGQRTEPAEIEILSEQGRMCNVRSTIHEGRNRQVRRMCEAIKHPVYSLKRISTGDLTLGDLPKGRYRALTEKEINYLKSLS